MLRVTGMGMVVDEKTTKAHEACHEHGYIIGLPGMSIKPTVALVLPIKIAQQMFTEGEMTLLKVHAEVVGPIMPEDPGFGAAVREAQVVLGGWGTPKFDDALLKQFPELRLLAYSAGSVKTTVTDSFYERGLKVTTSASANAVPVAEFTVAMMQALLKQVFWLAPAFARGGRGAIMDRMSHVRELSNLEVGLVGASRIGHEVVRLLKSYASLHVKMYDPYLSDEQAKEMGVSLSTLEEVCACEVVSIHAPNIPETRHMFNARMLALLPDHGILINTSRGALIDEQALVDEVMRRPLYVLLDVTDPEPPASDSKLRTLENVILTPHIAGAMNQARLEMGKLAIEEAIRFLVGQPLRYEVTKDMLATQA